MRLPLRCRIPEARFEAGFARVRAVLAVPDRSPPAVLDEAAAAAAAGPAVPAGADAEVRDATDLMLVAIDPAGSTDLDQAYGARRRGSGYRVHYAIADVASLVAPEGAIDTEARRRGVTLYSPDLRTSLHPEAISEQAGSLLAGEIRQALLWTIDLDSDAEPVAAHMQRATVRNRQQLSYRAAQQQIPTVDPDHPLALLREIGELRLQREIDRDAVSLRLPDQEVVRSADGRFALEYGESLPVESWNAQISLLTGMAGAGIMLDAGFGLLRTLPPPDPRTVSRLRRTARALGIEWPDRMGYAERVRGLQPDTPAKAALLAQSARGLRGAGYVAFRDHDLPEHPRHSAIASTYAHVTAPLRRLCDRFANEIIAAACADRVAPEWALAALDELPSHMGRATQHDHRLERAMVDLVEALVLSDRVGERFSGVVTDVDDDHGRVQLRDPAVVATLEGTDYALGDELEVVLVEADPEARRVVFDVSG